MPRRIKECQVESCKNKTYGILCKPHDNERRHNSKKFLNQSDYRRDWQYRKKYGISLDEFDAFWVIFKGRCGICNKELAETQNRRGQSLNCVAVDHNHKTGKVRGLLCNACNKGLGLFYENKEILKSAIKWLELEEE